MAWRTNGLRRGSLGLLGALVFLAACSSDASTPVASAPVSGAAPETTTPADTGPALPIELQQLIDATSLRDLDPNYADVELPLADDHVAVVVEADPQDLPQSGASGMELAYVSSLVRIGSSVVYSVGSSAGDGQLSCHTFGPFFGWCGPPLKNEPWSKPTVMARAAEGASFDVIYWVDLDAVLVDVSYQGSTIVRIEPVDGLITLAFSGTTPVTMTLYYADGTVTEHEIIDTFVSE